MEDMVGADIYNVFLDNFSVLHSCVYCMVFFFYT